MNKNLWPIQPTFISDCRIIGSKDVQMEKRKQSEMRFPNIHGVLKADELRGFLADASDDKHINNPLSLFQVVPIYFQGEDSNNRMKEIVPQDTFIKNILSERRIFRIDPGKLYSNFHCCDLYRKCNKGKNESLCYESDSRIALLYHPALESINYETDFDKYSQTLEVIVKEYNQHKNFPSDEYALKVEKRNDSSISPDFKRFLFIRYKCQYSNLEEFFFPVTYAGRVVAVLMQGQRFSLNMKKEDVFSGNIEDSRKGRKLERSIKNLGAKYFQEEPLSEERLQAIICCISRLEGKISDAAYEASHTYINNCFNGWQNEFRITVNNINISSDNALEQYKENLSLILKEIFEEFHDQGFIRIYTLQQYEICNDNAQNGYRFELIGDSSCAKSSQYQTMDFSFFPITQDVIEKDELLSYLKKPFVDFIEGKDTFRMEMPFKSHKAYIIWKRYDYIYYGEQERHNLLYKNTLKSFYPTLLEPYFILEGAKLEKKLEASMRISVHESAQIIPSVISAINNKESLLILNEGKAYNGNPIISKPMHTILDASHRLLLLEGLFRRSTLVFKNNPPKLYWCDFHRIIYSTKSLFDDRANRDKCQSLQIVNEGGFSRYFLYTDYAYLSHILFNLVDNAVKYGRKGSNVYIKVVLDFEKDFFGKEEVKNIRLSVINFGDEITDYKNIYKLYYRNSSSEIEGMGIGLYLVKKLCSSLHYRIECVKSIKISDINLPMHYFYREQNELAKAKISDEHKRILKKELPQNITKYVVNQHVSKNEWEVTELEIQKMIEKPIFQNEFQVLIPINNNFKERQ